MHLDVFISVHYKLSHKVAWVVHVGPFGVAAYAVALNAAEGACACAPVGCLSVAFIQLKVACVVCRDAVVAGAISARLAYAEVPSYDERNHVERSRKRLVAVHHHSLLCVAAAVVPVEERRYRVWHHLHRNACSAFILTVNGFRRERHVAPFGSVAAFVYVEGVCLNRRIHGSDVHVLLNVERVWVLCRQYLSVFVLPLLESESVVGRCRYRNFASGLIVSLCRSYCSGVFRAVGNVHVYGICEVLQPSRVAYRASVCSCRSHGRL